MKVTHGPSLSGWPMPKGPSMHVSSTPRNSRCAQPPLNCSLRLDGEDLASYPMKGTAPRGLTQEDDQGQADGLYDSEKNRAENLMIVDMVRNDMGRVAASGSVKVPSLFSIEKYPTLWQMTSKVTAQTKESLVGILGALFPPASITGAPKARTMHIISELETTPRGLYTGCIGYLSPGRQAQFNVAIRTAVIDKKKKEALYGVGGGIVWDSDDEQELEECRTKALVLTRESPDFSLVESILWTLDDGYFLLDEHLDRLESSAQYCDFTLDRQRILQKLQEITHTFSSSAYKVRLLMAKDGQLSAQCSAPFDGTGRKTAQDPPCQATGGDVPTGFYTTRPPTAVHTMKQSKPALAMMMSCSGTRTAS